MEQPIYCARCEDEIPPARLKVMPKTIVCVSCSEDIGGESTLEVSMGTVGKQGSLKRTGQKIEVQLKRKKFL